MATTWADSYRIDLLNDANNRLVSYYFDDKESAKKFIRRQQTRHDWKFAIIERPCGLWTRVLLYREKTAKAI